MLRGDKYGEREERGVLDSGPKEEKKGASEGKSFRFPRKAARVRRDPKNLISLQTSSG